MNWEAIGALGEVLGAAGVVVSLLYLASQVRQNTLAMRATSAASAAGSMREIIGPFLVDPARSGLVARGFEDPTSLSADEKAFMVNVSFNLLRQWETLHFQYVNGIAEGQLFDSYEDLYSQYMASPLLSEYWALRRTMFTPRFRDYIDALMADDRSESLRYGEVTSALGGSEAETSSGAL
jgi:hypothetical protein